MSDATTWPIAAGKSRDHKPTSMARGAFLLAALGLVLGLAFSIWVYFQGANALFVIAIVGSVSTIGMVGLAVTARLSRQAWIENLRKKEAEWQAVLSGLQVQLAESRTTGELLWGERAQANQNAARAEELNA